MDFYKQEFSKNNVYEKVQQADAYALNLLDYMMGEEKLSTDFSEREILHMVDVKNIVDRTLWLLYLSGALILIFLALLLKKSSYYSLAFSLMAGGIVTLSAMLLLALFTYFSFDNTFSISTWFFLIMIYGCFLKRAY